MPDPFSDQQDVHIIEARGLGRQWLAAATTRPEEAYAAIQVWRRTKPGMVYQMRSRPTLVYPFAVIEPVTGGRLYYIQMLKEQKILNRQLKRSQPEKPVAMCYIVDSDLWNPEGADLRERLENVRLGQVELSRLLRLVDFWTDCMTF